jgi:hypothetical protein
MGGTIDPFSNFLLFRLAYAHVKSIVNVIYLQVKFIWADVHGLPELE